MAVYRQGAVSRKDIIWINIATFWAQQKCRSSQTKLGVKTFELQKTANEYVSLWIWIGPHNDYSAETTGVKELFKPIWADIIIRPIIMRPLDQEVG